MHYNNLGISLEGYDMTDKKEKEKELEFPYALYENTLAIHELHFYISTSIGDATKYIDMIHRIRMAGPNDVIYIHLNSPGGNISTGVQIINAMLSSQAKIVTIIESEAHSLATMIFLCGDEFVVYDNCIMLFHNYSGGISGKGNEQESAISATVKWVSILLKKIYIPFMTEDEVDRILRGEDLWMHSDEIRKRLDRMTKKAKVLSKKKKQIAVS